MGAGRAAGCSARPLLQPVGSGQTPDPSWLGLASRAAEIREEKGPGHAAILRPPRHGRVPKGLLAAAFFVP